jgi:hypothetical protein
MENNNVESNMGNKKKNLTIIIVAAIVLVVIIVVILKSGSRNVEVNPEQQPLSQTDTDLNQATASDTTKAINSNLDNINVDDTSDADLGGVDQELNKL